MDQGLYETIQATACTPSLLGNQNMHSLTALNVLFAITASLGNALILLAIAALSYLKIYVTLCRHRTEVQYAAQHGKPNRSGMSTLSIKQYRKTVSMGLCIQLVLVACYLPYAIVVAMAHAQGYSPPYNLAVRETITLVFLNSSLNPIPYCWRIRGVRKAVKDTIKQ